MRMFLCSTKDCANDSWLNYSALGKGPKCKDCLIKMHQKLINKYKDLASFMDEAVTIGYRLPIPILLMNSFSKKIYRGYIIEVNDNNVKTSKVELLNSKTKEQMSLIVRFDGHKQYLFKFDYKTENK